MISAAAALICLLAAAAAVLSGPGYRWEWWTFRQGFDILRWAAWAGLFGAAVALAGAGRAAGLGDRRGLALALAALALGLATFAWPWHLARVAKSVPAIHDITTDTVNPPAFSAIVPLRAGAPNPLDYGGDEIARQQRQAYPDVAPLLLAVPPEEAFARALDAARRLHWTVVAADRQAGRIEAWDRTFWYGFVDDVVVRVAPDGPRSRIDVRSVSRVGRSDVGTNARRIRRFLAEVNRAG